MGYINLSMFDDGKWHFAVTVYDGQKLIYYIDGEEVDGLL